MIVKTRGIVLRNTMYSENSIITKMLTRELGLRTYIFPSIRKGKSPIRVSMIQPLSLVQMDVYEKSNSNINRVKELKNEPSLINIQEDIIKKSIALFMTEMLNHCIQEADFDIALFDFVDSQIQLLENNQQSGGLFPHYFLLGLAKYLGVDPQGKYSDSNKFFSLEEGQFVSNRGLNTLEPNSSLVISNILNGKIEIKANRELRQLCLKQLVRYFQIHVIKDKKIQSLEILSELFD